MVCVAFNLLDKERHHGRVGYIAGEIPSILGSILEYVTFFSDFYYYY